MNLSVDHTFSNLRSRKASTSPLHISGLSNDESISRMILLVPSTMDVNLGSSYSNRLPYAMEQMMLETAQFIGCVKSKASPATRENW